MSDETTQEASSFLKSLGALVVLLIWAALLPAFIHVVVNVATWSWNLV